MKLCESAIILFDSTGIKEVYLSCIITFYCFLLSPLFSSLSSSCSQWEENSYTLHSNIVNFVSFHYANYFHLRKEWNWMVEWDTSTLLFLAWIKPRIIFFLNVKSVTYPWDVVSIWTDNNWLSANMYCHIKLHSMQGSLSHFTSWQ